ncbi:MAG: thermonuclease family protein [Desulfovibrio sp.]|jgi:endonuclease YncB( thermonuclease family)|nr:thermonuclease family protein [Desulfovibrio sp.]
MRNFLVFSGNCRFFWVVLCLLFCLTAGGAFAARAKPPEKAVPQAKALSRDEGIVAYCFDGDTVKLTDRRVIRLAGVDAPELPRDRIKAQYYAREARQELIRLAQGKKVRLAPAGGVEVKDPNGRIVADLLIEDGQSLSALMVDRGAAFFYPHKEQDADFQKRLLELQRKSIAGRAGLWARLFSLPLALNNYVGNRASLRFFPADCPEVRHVKPRNRVYFGTLMDAFLAGYAPARVCLFWPSVP